MTKRRPKSKKGTLPQTHFLGPFLDPVFSRLVCPFGPVFGSKLDPLGSPLAPFWCHLRSFAPFFVESWPQVASKLNGAHAQSAKK